MEFLKYKVKNTVLNGNSLQNIIFSTLMNFMLSRISDTWDYYKNMYE